MKYYVELPEVWITEFLENDPDCDGYWISSLTQSWQKGYPDNCTVPWTNYVDVVRRLKFHTNKKIVVDVDMLFNEPDIAATIAKELYAVGCDTVVIESKRFPKVNSLTPDSMVLSTPEEFSRLINKVKLANPDLEIIARNEYLATTKDVDLTYNIAKRSMNAGADGIVIHWGGDANTTMLKDTLARLKKDGVATGIIPTKYLDQVVSGEFDGLADFSILGNICSSYIRHSFSSESVKSLLTTPCMFKPILDRVNSFKPKGTKTLIVLGAVPDADGQYLLGDRSRQKLFESMSDYYSVVFVVGADTEMVSPEQDNAYIVRVEDSLGEVHSISTAMAHLNTENVTVVYADVEQFGLDNINAPGMLFKGDVFAGVLNVGSDILMKLVQSVDPTSSIINMGMKNSIKSTVIE